MFFDAKKNEKKTAGRVFIQDKRTDDATDKRKTDERTDGQTNGQTDGPQPNRTEQSREKLEKKRNQTDISD